MSPETRIRYFVVSPFKTGTTSVEKALLQIGAGRKAMPYQRMTLKTNKPLMARHRGLAKDAKTAAAYLRDHGDDARQELDPLIKAARRYDIFADAPMGHGHVHPVTLKALFPEARLIWVERPLNSWLASVEAWETARPDIYPHAQMWQDDPEQRKTMLHNMRRRRFNAFKAAESQWPDHCLRLDPGAATAMAELAAFCGLPDPGAPLPHENARR